MQIEKVPDCVCLFPDVNYSRCREESYFLFTMAIENGVTQLSQLGKNFQLSSPRILPLYWQLPRRAKLSEPKINQGKAVLSMSPHRRRMGIRGNDANHDSAILSGLALQMR